MKNRFNIYLKFDEIYSKKMRINYIKTGILLLFTIFCLSLIVTLNKNGFNDIDLLWKINRKLIIIIPLGSFGLALSSFLLQQLSLNRLADSSILGIGNANLIFIMLLIYNIDLGNDIDISIYKNTYPIMFLAISIIVSLSIFFITNKRNKNISKKFIVTGIILNFSFIAISYSLNSLMPSNKSMIIKDFSIGFIDNIDNNILLLSSLLFLISMIWLMIIYQKFNIITTNENIARELGININDIYLQIFIIVGILVASSYMVIGNVTFLGMISSNIAFSFFKKTKSFSLINSGIISTLIVSITFFVNTNILASSVNTTLLVSIISIPYFLYIVIKE